jgi:DNA-binding NarL/FixJ family response regulator
MRVVVLEDHHLIGQAIGGLLSELCGIELLALCATPAEAISTIASNPTDLLITDLDLAGESPDEAIALLLHRNPKARFIVLSAHTGSLSLPPELEESCLGVVDKAQDWMTLEAVLMTWLKQQSTPSPATQAVDLERLNTLAPRERRLLLELGRGLVNKELAPLLGISISSVETYRKSIASKLGVSGPELLRLAVLLRCTAVQLKSET